MLQHDQGPVARAHLSTFSLFCPLCPLSLHPAATEEGRLSWVGATTGLPAISLSVLVDLGGRSTEVAAGGWGAGRASA